MSVAFSVKPSADKCLNSSSYVTFCEAINLRGDISKLSASIGTLNISSEPCSVFDIEKPYFCRWNKVESTLSSVLKPVELKNIEVKVYSAQAS